MITSTPGGVLIDVRVIPRTGRAGLAGARGGMPVIRLQAPPIDGAANAELIEILSDLFGVSRRAVTIVGGQRGRVKRVHVEGVSAHLVAARLKMQDEPTRD